VNLLTDKGEDTDEWALQMDTFGGFGSLTWQRITLTTTGTGMEDKMDLAGLGLGLLGHLQVVICLWHCLHSIS
jgi:hypothetical protein